MELMRWICLALLVGVLAGGAGCVSYVDDIAEGTDYRQQNPVYVEINYDDPWTGTISNGGNIKSVEGDAPALYYIQNPGYLVSVSAVKMGGGLLQVGIFEGDTCVAYESTTTSMGVAATSMTFKNHDRDSPGAIILVETPTVSSTKRQRPSESANEEFWLNQSTSSKYYSGNEKLIELTYIDDEDWHLLFDALIADDHPEVVKHAEASYEHAQTIEKEVKRLSVTRDFQTIKSLFIQYLEFKKVVCDNYKYGAMRYAYDNLTRLDETVEELDSQLTAKGY